MEFPMNGTNYTAPAECVSARGAMPDSRSPGFNYNYWVAVPVYQQSAIHVNETAMLQSCCPYGVWLANDPHSCVAVCNTTSTDEMDKTAQCVSRYGSDYTNSMQTNGVMPVRIPGVKSMVLVLVFAELLFQSLF